jgi:hypothetical protein
MMVMVEWTLNAADNLWLFVKNDRAIWVVLFIMVLFYLSDVQYRRRKR